MPESQEGLGELFLLLSRPCFASSTLKSLTSDYPPEHQRVAAGAGAWRWRLCKVGNVADVAGEGQVLSCFDPALRNCQLQGYPGDLACFVPWAGQQTS